MKKYYLEGSRDFYTDEAKRVALNYFIIESQQIHKNSCQNIFGLRIVKKQCEDDQIIFEEETVSKISYSKSYVKALLDKLMFHLVTPVSMVEVLDDLMS